MSNNTRLAELMNYITIDTTSGNQFQMSGSIKQTSVTSALLKASATGVLTAATAGTDYLTSVGISNLTATGTPSATTYLRGDNTWATVSGGASSVATLTDVVLTSVANGDVLQYNSATSKWINAVVSGGGSGVTLDTAQTITGQKTFQGTTSSDSAVLGAELANITATATNWALAGGATNLSSGGYTHTSGSTTSLVFSLTPSIGTAYKISYTTSGLTTGNCFINFGGSSTYQFTNGSGTLSPVATNTNALTLVPSTDFNGTIVVSIKAVSASSATTIFTTSTGASSIEIRSNNIAGNSFIGYQSGAKNTTGANNTFIGYNSGISNTSANNNTFLGKEAGTLVNTGNDNTLIGSQAGKAITIGYGNSFFGTFAGLSHTIGYYNAFFGLSSGGGSGTGSAYNVAMGYNSFSAVTGTFGVAIGAFSLYSDTSSQNTAIGYATAMSKTSGSNNVFVGHQAGRYISGGSTNVTNAANSIFIGYNAYPLADTQSNQIVIGYQTVGLGSNTTTIGNSSTVDSVIYGNLVLGSTSTGVGYKLNVTGTTIYNNTSAMDTGVTLGANQLTSSGWGTLPANWSGDFATGYVITAGGGTLTNTLSLPQYSFFTATITANVTTAGSLDIYCGGTSGDAYFGSSSIPVGTNTVSRTAFTTTAGTTSIVASSTLVATISNIQIQLVTGTITPNVTFNSSSGTNKIQIRLDNVANGSTTSNLFVGHNSGAKFYTGAGNTSLGSSALAEVINAIGNTAIGTSSQPLNKVGYTNTSVGYNTLYSMYSGSQNVAIGALAMYTLNLASWNVSVGRESLYSLLSGTNNVAIGDVALRSLAGSSSNNVGIGESVGKTLTSGGQNVLIGEYNTNVAGITSCDFSTIIGYSARPLATAQTNQIVIGNGTTGLGSNTTIIGNSSTTLTALYGTVITGGTSANAAAQLQIDSTTKGVLFPRMTTTQKNAIATPPAGLVVYDTDLAKLCVRTASAWETITSA